MSDSESREDITRLLQAWHRGEEGALDRLLPLVYDQLRRVARARLRGGQPGNSLDPTALVHEAYLRLLAAGGRTPQNRVHLFALAARVMRQILVDHARRRNARKRGGAATVVTLHEWVRAPEVAVVDLLALDEALTELHARDPRLCRVVELKFFGGLNTNETADALQVSAATVERDWTVSKAWLHQRLSPLP
jgi:RNA polymerase sigma factor (TIGR02999 family)